MRSDGLKRTFAKGLTVENCATKDPLGVHALKRTSVPYPNLARDAPVRKTTKSSVFTPLEGRIPLRFRPHSKVTAVFRISEEGAVEEEIVFTWDTLCGALYPGPSLLILCMPILSCMP